MPIFRIPRTLTFPPPHLAEPSGLLGVGGDLGPERLLLGYRSGIFPWYSEGQPVLWWSPDPRMVLYPDRLTIPRSLAKTLRQGRFTLTLDQAFSAVIAGCAESPRRGQAGTWLTPALRDGLEALFAAGYAHSCEAWRDGELVGGLYGVAVGRFFSGESMFARAPDASKVAFVHWMRQLTRWGYPLVDCQVHTDHLARFGAEEIPRADYLAALPDLVNAPGRPGHWSFDADFHWDL